MALHLPLGKWLTLHGTCAGGILKPISYNGLCKPPTISDRFFVGGPMQLRGFLPAGIGPRTNASGVSPGGDALGGSLYYTASLAASVAPGGMLAEYGVLFSFANAGTLVGTNEGVPIQANGGGCRNFGSDSHGTMRSNLCLAITIWTERCPTKLAIWIRLPFWMIIQQ
jgi:outer membrane protein assembly factor BamA